MARQVANRVIFTADGEFLEDGKPDQIFDNPQHHNVWKNSWCLKRLNRNKTGVKPQFFLFHYKNIE